MEKTNFLQSLKDKGSYYLIVVVLVIVAVYVGFLFYINSVAMGPKETIDPAKGLEKSRLSDLNLDKFEKTNYYKFQNINQENYPDKLPEEEPYNKEEINVQRENPFMASSQTSDKKETTKQTAKTTTQSTVAQTPTQSATAQTQQASVSDSVNFAQVQTPATTEQVNYTPEETFGAPTETDLNSFNFEISY